ncbi:hypothetical protein VJ923_05950 [Adlercreutzia sp. R25]|uniref:Uncharacterized protein n=1 Tax=Adlercreutzia shanghongiae TaxID=3111773 RepID=A0ABU6IXH1_9ACTN|nr:MULTISPECIES: hypothetical protein [unclassified Adlercreutzia]MEC4272697.1 hypothetical protein [Adlercreutzia sp. R25]MEC4294403.1 hypothetical protein [Adlercreutzia sp. R22]
METSKVKCRECKARATQYEGMLPTRGIAKVLVAGFAIYIVGLWVLVALAALTTGDIAEAGFMDMLILLAVAVTIITACVVWWMFRPKKGKVVVCDKCGARYAVTPAPNYVNGWNYDRIAPREALALPADGGDAGEGVSKGNSAPSAAESKES